MRIALKVLVVVPVIAMLASAASASERTKPKRISAAAAFSLPAANHCVDRGELKLRVRKVSHVRWVQATLAVNGKRVKTVRGAKLTKPIVLTGLSSARIVVSISAKATGGRSAKATRTYRACATKRVKPGPKPAPVPTVTPPVPTPAPTATPAVPAPEAGRYSGSNGQNGNGISLYLSADGGKIQDVYDSAVGLSCSGGGGTSDHLGIDEIAIGPDGSFSSTTVETGLFAGGAATYTYQFSGHVVGAGFAGTYREDIAFNDGNSTCTSNVQAWSAARNAEPSQTAAPSPPGSYHGANGQNGNGLSFFVDVGSSQIQDVYDSAVGLSCMGGGGTTDHLGIDEIAIAPDGSFSSTTTQTGLIGGGAATYTYTFRGHFHGTDASGRARAAGTYREDITYNNGNSTCTSHTQSWSTTRDIQPVQTASAPPAGVYSGSNGQNGNGLSFAVSPGSLQLVNVLDTAVGLACLGGGGATDKLTVADVAIASDGSFSSVTTAGGLFNGTAATFTYTFQGHFHGTNAAGTARAAGTYREDITYNNGNSRCTSLNQSWSATHA